MHLSSGPPGPPLAHVVLVEPEIHWNAGNAGRTCLAAGARLHLVRPLGFSLDDKHVRRAGLDYWPRVAPIVWNSWDALERSLPELGEPYFFSSEAAQTFWELELPASPVLLFGSESVGLPRALRDRFRDRLVRLPVIDPEVRSLNVSTCVAVALYELLRRVHERSHQQP